VSVIRAIQRSAVVDATAAAMHRLDTERPSGADFGQAAPLSVSRCLQDR
jgi:hypothetical protein